MSLSFTAAFNLIILKLYPKSSEAPHQVFQVHMIADDSRLTLRVPITVSVFTSARITRFI